jgi:deoxyribose-phosphate aldolase
LKALSSFSGRADAQIRIEITANRVNFLIHCTERKADNVTGIDEKQLAGCIDHTLLKATATREQIERLSEEAIDYGFHTVFVNSRWLGLVADKLHASKVKVGGVVSFPLGADSVKIKVAAAKDAIFTGADEIDMVADLAAIMAGDGRYLSGELTAVLKVCRSMRPAVTLKVIIEAAALNDEQKIFACRIAEECGVDFIKTSTGMHPAGGARIEDVKLIRNAAPNCRIKASGGIRTAKEAVEMLQAGAERIGTSSGVEIIKEFQMGEAQ